MIGDRQAARDAYQTAGGRATNLQHECYLNARVADSSTVVREVCPTGEGGDRTASRSARFLISWSDLAAEMLYRFSLDGWANDSSGDVQSRIDWFARISISHTELQEVTDAFSEVIDGAQFREPGVAHWPLPAQRGQPGLR